MNKIKNYFKGYYDVMLKIAKAIANYFKGYYDVIKDKKFQLEIAKTITIIIITAIAILWRILWIIQ